MEDLEVLHTIPKRGLTIYIYMYVYIYIYIHRRIYPSKGTSVYSVLGWAVPTSH